MKFVHIADMHFDIPFTGLDVISDLGDSRRLEQREAFKKIIEYISQNDIKYLFISGDLYEHEYVQQSTIEYINRLFAMIPNTQIYITPGNHDPKLKNSYYTQYKWNKNVVIFDSKITKYENEEVDIYGYGFDDFYSTNSRINEIKIENKQKINILITHADLNGVREGQSYNSISKQELEMLGFDYIALGHIHKPYYNDEDEQRIVYPGSVISLGFDELGKHGIIEGEITKERLELHFIPIDNKEFIEIEMDISELNTEEEIIEMINNVKLEDYKYYKIILVGQTNIEINKYKIIKNIENKNILKIKINTKIEINLEEIEKENNIKGLFIKEINRLKREEEISEEIIQNAVEIGLGVLEE